MNIKKETKNYQATFNYTIYIDDIDEYPLVLVSDFMHNDIDSVFYINDNERAEIERMTVEERLQAYEEEKNSTLDMFYPHITLEVNEQLHKNDIELSKEDRAELDNIIKDIAESAYPSARVSYFFEL